MPYYYTLLNHAQEDYENALQWYAQRSIKGAKELVKAVDDALQLILEHPDRWRNSYKNFHELKLKNFPFSIIFTIEENEQLILITAIFHQKRNQKKKYKK